MQSFKEYSLMETQLNWTCQLFDFHITDLPQPKFKLGE